MDILSLIHNKKFFGREFLTWLWFQSDSKSGMIALDESQKVEIWVDNKIILESADEETLEKVIWSWPNREGRLWPSTAAWSGWFMRHWSRAP